MIRAAFLDSAHALIQNLYVGLYLAASRDLSAYIHPAAGKFPHSFFRTFATRFSFRIYNFSYDLSFVINGQLLSKSVRTTVQPFIIVTIVLAD